MLSFAASLACNPLPTVPNEYPQVSVGRWAPYAERLATTTPAPILDWLFDQGSLTRRLTRLSRDHFSVTPLFEGWQALRDDECLALGLAPGSEGWVREVYLRGHGEPWVFARSVAGRQALRDDGLDLEALGSRSLGELLFCDQGFVRQAIEVCHYPRAWLPAGQAADNLWGRRSRFDRGALGVLVAEVFLPGLWHAAEAFKETR
ncbi:chorismate--pyruvate lyase family protein [Pseudomonas putida]|uniref:Probable chorismate pyruvate-lyase n=1 Tax=Pseudomonas putida TaxID=303 RepID=A0A177SSB1_PSEPU|nr:chorismate--pyruvate lyase [Pseudomonas putida]